MSKMENFLNNFPKASTAGNPYSKKLHSNMLFNNYVDPKTGKKDKYDQDYVKRKINHDVIEPLFPEVDYEEIEDILIELCVNILDKRKHKWMQNSSEIIRICEHDPDMQEYVLNRLGLKPNELQLKDSAMNERDP